ncbi:CobW family GTP-binding protein [Shewanella litoralis]|uniref:Cobalamin biosynthesis protein CobW n=1 Tax=Shewanella litoralis TaxID=2282700 RepID=A0ABQ2RDQ9_9GAMM|nr:GTP-binding protein [Shewanella litoralis]GGQ21960.1 cobalamin biosynthesis protein CobW [Shewanella litoralis]
MITKPINTNIITGFLGVGKTTLIKALLANKPEHEVWAVLVNEFGEIGIDGGLLNAGSVANVVIKEVPGGCLCCAAGVPTQVAINQIIQQAKPDRLLIEPTGLGHPAEIVKLLQAAHLQQVINVQTTVCLVDARKVSDSRYYSHDIFIQQLQIADIVIANKAQQYGEQEQQHLIELMARLGRANTPIIKRDDYFNQKEQLQQIIKLLTRRSDQARSNFAPTLKSSLLLSRTADQWLLPMVTPTSGDDKLQQQLAEQGYIYKTNQGECCFSYGWIVDSQRSAVFERFMAWVESVKSLNVIRLKAIVITFDGILSVNMVDDKLTLDELDDALDSRIEIISGNPLDGDTLQQQLFECY